MTLPPPPLAPNHTMTADFAHSAPSGSCQFWTRTTSLTFALTRTLSVWLCLATVSIQAAAPAQLSHVTVFGEPGKFGGWPANHGIWQWGNELLVGFSIGTHQDLGQRHNIDRDKPEHHVLARSLDGGQTWQLEYPQKRGQLINHGGMRHGITDPSLKEKPATPLDTPIRFDHPDFAMTTRFDQVHGGSSRLYYSYDRGRNWAGPFQVPGFGQPGVMARTDYVTDGRDQCICLYTVSKQNRREGRVLCVATQDGGKTWQRRGFVGAEPHGFSIMSSTVRLGPQHLLTTTRRREGEDQPKRRWIDVWRSRDDGQTWTYVTDAAANLGEGNPASLLRLQDGRLCLTYGVRKRPFEILAKLSDDEGQTWGEPIVLETGGAGRDLGYPRSIQRPDGTIVTVYYFQPADSPYRQIRAALWKPVQQD